jgi:protein O-GlcNAc transferase
LVHFSSVELEDVDSPARDLVKRQLAARGVDPLRVVYRGWLPLSRHLDEIGEADIALDTFPYNGTTTTCECLWMGVPVVTLTGQTHAGRVGYEILDRAGLSNFAAPNQRSYIETAVGLAQNPDCLRHLRFSLRDQFRKSGLLNPEPLVREIEQGYSNMWEQYLEENL